MMLLKISIHLLGITKIIMKLHPKNLLQQKLYEVIKLFRVVKFDTDLPTCTCRNSSGQ